jgi:hypothetical protein
MNFVGKKIEKRETADSDVRAAMESVRANEQKHSLASELGHDGVSKMESWDSRISQIGANAATEAAQLYASQPKPAAKAEEPEHPDQHINAARSAYKAAQAKAEREASMPATLAGLNRMERRWGDLAIVDTYKKWDEQLRADPADAAGRIASEINQHINDSIEMQRAHKTVTDYESVHKLEPEVRSMMQSLLSSGAAHDMRSAHQAAYHLLAKDEKDPHRRDIVAAKRQAEFPQQMLAQNEVAMFRQRFNPSPAVEKKMMALLNSEKAKSLEQAYKMAGGK